jgi:hypothetical protein
MPPKKGAPAARGGKSGGAAKKGGAASADKVDAEEGMQAVVLLDPEDRAMDPITMETPRVRQRAR